MVTFGALQARLIAFVNMRIQNGEYTERGLARLLGISQPQIHHVLKGTRRLQPEFADRVMARFGVTVLDLLQEAELSSELSSRQSEMADLRWYAARRPEQERTHPEDRSPSRERKPAARCLGLPFRAEKAG
jgi:plasmid maintenance system antidote protein VapI